MLRRIAHLAQPRLLASAAVVLAVLLGVTLYGVLSGGGHRSEAAFPGTNGEIAFTSARDGNWEIYVMSPDGSGQTRLTNNGAPFDGDPAWSPDGTKIAFRSDRDGPNEIYVMNADGSGQTNLTNSDSGDYSPAWSPDGTKIAFHSVRDGNYEIYVMNADGSGQTRLTNNSASDWDPAWSPDGTKIAYESNRDVGTSAEIYVMNADGSGQTRITTNTAQDFGPDWSPDGTKIAFTSARDGGNDEVYVMNADGSGQTRLTTTPGWDGLPAWSPDGTKIAFGSDQDGVRDIFVMNADGSGQTNLSNNVSGQDDWPDWQPVTPATPTPTPPTILTVTKTADTGDGACDSDCSLREAIQTASANSYPDTIGFDPAVFQLGAPATISLTSDLPALSSGGDTVDGSTAGVIVDGGSSAVACFDITSNGNTIKGLEIYNCGYGVHIHPGANNTIGGTTSAERNVISGGYFGVLCEGGGCQGNTIIGNYIGLSANGDSGVPNSDRGVVIKGGAQNNIIGGTTSEERNVISGNGSEGVRIDDPGTQGNMVLGNYIGTDATGAAPVPNGQGILIAGHASMNTIGGAIPGGSNLIAYNDGPIGGHGVVVTDVGTVGNTIRGNSIHSNAGKGIENRDGGNTELAPPSLTATGSVSGTSCANCIIDVFSDDSDQGRTYEGSTTADGAGNWTFVGALEGPNVTATATDSGGNTSEFSSPLALPTPTPTPTPTPPPDLLGDIDCNGSVNSVDALKLLRHVAGLSVSQNEPCDEIGTGDPLQGDVDCDGIVNAVDALKVLRFVAGLKVAQTEPCPDIGTPTGGG